MEARVKEKSRISTVTAGGGQHFVKPQWSHVEPGTEAEIKASPFLDVRNDSVAVVEPKSKAKAKGKAKTKAKPKAKAKSKSKPPSESKPESKSLPDPPEPSVAIKGANKEEGSANEPRRSDQQR